MVELAGQIFLLLLLLRFKSMLTGGLPFWHKGFFFGALNFFLCSANYLIASGGVQGVFSQVLFWVFIGAMNLVLPCAYFYGVDRIPGRLNLPFVVLGGALLVFIL